jgi:hypothetical protein
MRKSILSITYVVFLSAILLIPAGMTQNAFAETNVPASEENSSEFRSHNIKPLTIDPNSVVINFDDLGTHHVSLGTSFVNNDVTFSTSGSALVTSPTCCGGTSPNSLGSFNSYFDFNGDILVELPENVCASNFEFLSINPPVQAEAFDVNGNSIGVRQASTFAENLTFEDGGVHSVLITGGFYVIDNLSFLPEPCGYTIYGTDAGQGNLFTIDQNTGERSIIGQMDAGGPSLAIDPTTGIMYAGGSGGNDSLYTVNKNTAETTLIGSSGLGFAAIPALEFAPDGTLFASVNIAGNGGTGGDHLATIDKETGVATVIGPYGECTPSPIPIPTNGFGSCTIERMAALAFGPDGTLWGGTSHQGKLYTIDISTGQATFVSNITSDGEPIENGVGGLIFIDDVLYGGTRSGGDFVTISTNPGEITFIGNTVPEGTIGALAKSGPLPEEPALACTEYDFNDGVSDDFDGVTTTESVDGFTAEGFSGDYLRNKSTGNPADSTILTIDNLPEHTTVDVGFLLAIIDSWDGENVGDYSPDILNVKVDGTTIFSEGFRGAGGAQSYVPSPDVLLLSIDAGQDRAGSGWSDSAYNMANEPIFQGIPHTDDTVTIEWFASGSGWQGGNDESWAIDNVKIGLDGACTPPKTDKSGGGDNQWDTRPTFGVSHETRQGLIVENGFSFNGDYFTVTDNHHTDFAEQSVEIGTMNSFTATVYADKQLKVQEFLFGIPNVGESHLAELGVEVWYDRDGAIEDIVVDQDTAVIDEGTISVSHEKTKCLSTDVEPLCDTTTVSMTFLEPLADKVMAVKAIDYANRDQRTYLNDGFDISGESLNPMLTQMIPSNVKNQGLLEVTQLAKYSPYWQSAEGRMFEMNSFGSFKEINQTFERFQDTGSAFTRMHSGFGGILDYEQNRATQVFDSTKLISDLPDSFGYHFEMTERLNDQLINDMLEQQEIAKKILEEMDKQNRHH